MPWCVEAWHVYGRIRSPSPTYRDTNMVYFFVLKLIQTLLVYETVFLCTFERRGAIQISNHNANKTEQVSKPLTVTAGFLKIHKHPPPPPKKKRTLAQCIECIEYFKDFLVINCITFPKAFPVIIVSDDLLKGGYGC